MEPEERLVRLDALAVFVYNLERQLERVRRA